MFPDITPSTSETLKSCTTMYQQLHLVALLACDNEV